MPNLTEVTLTNGTPTAGTGNVSTIDALMAQLLSGLVLAAGNQLVGKVGIDQTTPGTTNKVDIATIAVDGSGTITLGGTAQNLFGGATPVNGFGIYNPDANEDLWISLSTTAVLNGQGSIRIAANGGGYETPSGSRPFSSISVIGLTTGHKFTAIRW